MQQVIESFDDQAGIYAIFGIRFAFRDSLVKAIRYANEAALDGNYPTAIVAVGQNYRLDRSGIVRNWKRLGLPLPAGWKG
jgi:hypothetical protein